MTMLSDGDGLGDSACDPEPKLCPPAPLPGCRAPAAGKASIDIKNNADDEKDSVKWKWGKGEATTLADIGNPVSGWAHYSLCIYDDSADPQPLLEAAAVARAQCAGKSCWKAQGTKGYGYKDKSGHTTGTQQLKLTAGDNGKAKIGYKGMGANLGPLPLSPTPTLPMTVQLIVNDGDRQDCWEATYSTSDIAEPDRFKAKSD